jgi:carbon storage regulator
MLVLSRKQGQSIVIANDIVISVVDIGHGRVQIGVTAPAHLPIHREEIHRRIQKENQMRRLAAFPKAGLREAKAECVGAV